MISVFSVANHGISEHIIESVISASKMFFHLSEEEKLKVCGTPFSFLSLSTGFLGCLIQTVLLQLDIRKSSGFKGYQPLLSSNNNPENMGDMHEGYEVGWEPLDPKFRDLKRANDGVMKGENVWPDELPCFRESILEY